MDEDSHTDDPLYRFGAIMGRMGLITELLARLADSDAGGHWPAGPVLDLVQRQSGLSEWIEQVRSEIEADFQILLAELQAAEIED